MRTFPGIALRQRELDVVETLWLSGDWDAVADDEEAWRVLLDDEAGARPVQRREVGAPFHDVLHIGRGRISRDRHAEIITAADGFAISRDGCCVRHVRVRGEGVFGQVVERVEVRVRGRGGVGIRGASGEIGELPRGEGRTREGEVREAACVAVVGPQTQPVVAAGGESRGRGKCVRVAKGDGAGRGGDAPERRKWIGQAVVGDAAGEGKRRRGVSGDGAGIHDGRFAERHDAEFRERHRVQSDAARVVAVKADLHRRLHEDVLRLAELRPCAGDAAVVRRVQRGDGIAAADETQPARFLRDAVEAAGAALRIRAPDEGRVRAGRDAAHEGHRAVVHAVANHDAGARIGRAGSGVELQHGEDEIARELLPPKVAVAIERAVALQRVRVGAGVVGVKAGLCSVAEIFRECDRSAVA